MRNIRKRYEAKGFPDAKVKDKKKDKKKDGKDDSQRPGVRQVDIVIDEGVKYTVSELKISGAETVITSYSIHYTKLYETFPGGKDNCNFNRLKKVLAYTGKTVVFTSLNQIFKFFQGFF